MSDTLFSDRFFLNDDHGAEGVSIWVTEYNPNKGDAFKDVSLSIGSDVFTEFNKESLHILKRLHRSIGSAIKIMESK